MTINTMVVLGAGKKWGDYVMSNDDYAKTPTRVYCVDKMYLRGEYRIQKNVHLVPQDIFNYLEGYIDYPVNTIVADRVFEHISYDRIPYLLYLCKECLADQGKISITVPDFDRVFDQVRMLDGGIPAMVFNRAMIDCHTEIFNTPEDPHQSIWTKSLAHYYFGLEEFWKDINISEFSIDNRSWYMRIQATKK